MKILKSHHFTSLPLIFSATMLFSSCLTSKRMNAFISDQYNNEIPRVNKRTQPANIFYTPPIHSDADISVTTAHTRILPLIVYWVIDDRKTSTLNPGIAAADFENTINKIAYKGLMQKLNGQRLELAVQQAPCTFALVDKTHAVWLIYAIHWEKVYIEPQPSDLVVSYRLSQQDGSSKSGTITIKNPERNKNLGFFQSWRSAVSQHLEDYDSNMTDMTKEFVDELMKQL